MCRLMAYVGPPICCADLLFRPTNSIVRQSFDAKQRANGAKLENPYAHGSLNADGFGMAFYGSFEGEEENEKKLPCVFTELLPAWNSKNLRRLSEKVHAKLFFAHIRAAGPSPDGQISICDCKTHPFTFGRYSFMHNGEIAGFALIRRKLLSMLKRDESFNVAMLHGATDTAVAFAIFVDQLPEHNGKLADLPSTAILQMLKQTLEIIYRASNSEPSITGQSKLNFVVTDGRVVIATRYAFGSSLEFGPITAPSLYYCSGSNFKKPTEGNSEFLISHAERSSKMTIVSSEPLTEVKGDWVSVPFNHVVVIQSTGETLCGPLYFKVEPCPGAAEATLELDRTMSKIEESISFALEGENPILLLSPRRALVKPPPLMRMISSSIVVGHTNEGALTSRQRDHDLLCGKYGAAITMPFHILADSGQVHVSCMAQLGKYLFVADGGAAKGRVCWFSLETYELVAFNPSYNVLALVCCKERNLLFGSRSDGKIMVWGVDGARGETHAFTTISFPEIGHVLSMKLQDNVLFIGSQDGNIRRINVEDVSKPFVVQDAVDTKSGTMRQLVRVEQADAMPCDTCPSVCPATRSHCGFVNSTVIFRDSLFSGGSCGVIKRWDITPGGEYACQEVISGHGMSITDMCIVEQRNWLLSSSLDGTVRAWRVGKPPTTVHVKTFRANGDAITCLAPIALGFCAGTVSGLVWIWKFTREQHMPTAFFSVSSSPINTLRSVGEDLVFVGAKSGRITVWELPQAATNDEDDEDRDSGVCASAASDGEEPKSEHAFFAPQQQPQQQQPLTLDNKHLLAELKRFVNIPSVSANPARYEACLESAAYLRQLVETLGGETRVVQGSKIPTVLARFKSALPNPENRYVFVYGHHDVVDVVPSRWESDPFELVGREAYVFGRGVSDNKGPCLAMLFATAKLLRNKLLGLDVMFCFEGENETDMNLEERDFLAMLRENRAGMFFPDHSPELVVVSNNTWITNHTPCLTYGMRGIVDIALRVTLPGDDSADVSQQHSTRKHGLRSATDPVEDLISVLSTCSKLTSTLEKHATPLGEREMERLKQVGLKIESDVKCSVSEVIKGWISPQVLISAVHSSSDCFRRVPFEATAKVTVHFVPGLTEETALGLALEHFKQAFTELNTVNKTVVVPKFTGKWWVGDVDNVGFKAFSRAIEEVWGEPPLLVRSGTRDSSMTVLLEREFQACCVNFPMASNGDYAHQSNERIKLANLYAGRAVFEHVLLSLGDIAKV